MAPPSEMYQTETMASHSGLSNETYNTQEKTKTQYESNGKLNGPNDTNGHHNGSNETKGMNDSNGSTRQNGHHAPNNGCLISSSGLEQWKKDMEDILERCDLSGLTRDPVKYQLASTGVDGVAQSTKERVMEISGDLLQNLRATSIKRKITEEKLLILAIHQMLKGFGNGTHTVTATFTRYRQTSQECAWTVFPTCTDHSGRDKKYMSTAISEMQIPSGPDDRFLIEVAPGELVRAELLDLMIVLEGAIDDAPVPGFPLVLGAKFTESQWNLTIRYADKLFNTMVVDSFLSAMRKLLEATTRPMQLLGEIELLPEEQLAQMDVWNDTDGKYPSEKRLHHLVEEAAEQNPDQVAVICGEKRITYKELNAQANRLANHICRRGIQPEQLIGLFLDKSEMMIVTILGVWKSGAAHVPIDPAYPDERIQFVLDDVNTSIIIASQRHVPRLQRHILAERKIEIITLEPLLEALAVDSSSLSHDNLTHLNLTSKQLAYVTYTSGTTGFPKGIFKEHTSVVNSITDLSSRYHVAGNNDEVILLFSAYVFEPFVRQMLMALTTGNKLAIISDEEKFDPNTLLPYIRKHRVTYVNGTASVLQEYDFTTCPSLKRMILVGENLTDSRYTALRQRFKGTILNEYGFTESAFVTALNVFEPDSRRLDMSLGRPVRNVKCYILDANLKRVPLGVTGELHIGGLGISRGYMNREELTRKKFLLNPYQTTRERQLGWNSVLYKTGDLARWLPSGEVEYLGRIDFQIKLRGIRIEPGEIESTLALYPGVRTSIVVSKKLLSRSQETSQDHLVGYFVCDVKTLPEHDLLAFLDKKLPRYMIPTRLVQLPAIPVTINGKADLRALPTVEVTVTSSCAVQYRDELDEKLAQIWADVLEIPCSSIGLDHSFFRLGGHSITCIQLLARVRKFLHAGISLEEVFQTRTLRVMADLLRSRANESLNTANGHTQSGAEPCLDGVVQSSYIANSLQQGFVYQSLKTQQTDLYIMQSILHYGVPLRQDLYRKAWEHIHRQHPTLRLRFTWEDDVVQIVDSDAKLDWRIVDATGVQSEAELEQKLAQIQEDDHKEGYALSMASLLRLYFMETMDLQSLCVFSCHHSVLDGWSLPLLFERLHDTYLCLLNDKSPPLKEDLAYVHAQRYLEEHRDDHLEFWAQQIGQVEERCDLNALLNEASRYKVPLADYDRIQEQGQQSIFLPQDESMKRLLEECSGMGVTLHSVLQLVWHLVLHAYGGGSHTVTGTTISGRNLPVEGIERSIGLFINTLPLVLNHMSYRDMTAIDAIAQVQGQVNAMNSRGNVELGRLSKDDLKHGLFDTLFVLENYPNLDKSQRAKHEQLLKCKVVGGTEKLSYPLAVVAQEHGDAGCNLTICYARELFTDDTIKVLLQTARDTLQNIARNPKSPIRDIEYLSVDQVEQLDKWNATDDEYPSGTLHSIFEIEAQRQPGKIAVIYEDRELTYKELNSRANAMAFHLLNKVPIQPNKLVALVIDKSEHLIASILAVWKSGGAYVPIDPSYPDDRIHYILQDTSALAVIADEKYIGRLSKLVCDTGTPVIPSDEATRLPVSPTHPKSSCTAADLAYVMYTSGTTGKPKGVMVEHHGVVNLAVSLSKIFGLKDTNDEVILSFSNYVFDHFVEQMTDALLNGQTLLVLNDEMRGDKERLYRYIEANRVTYLSGTPSVISMYEFGRFRDHLRRIDCVGEAFSEPVFDKIRETFPGLVINGYGPTEVSITTHKRLYPYPERRTDKSIGRQVANSTSYVLNDDMKRVPIGAVGELYLGGDGVARGYHNRLDLTAERFPPNPFQTEQEKREGRNARLYKTGDLVRWIESADGEVEYLGRNDFQVKIRGQRIELGEIEAVLSSYPEVVQSIVLAKDRVSDGQKYLVGYYVSSGSLSPQAIRRYMQARLPSHMVPTKMIPLDKFPVTVSGKLDSKALPVPDESSEEDVVPPRTEVERVVAKIWADLLEIPIDSIGIYSDFFTLGGDSLRSTKLSFAATKALGVSVTVSDLFRYPTIEAFARWIVSGSADTTGTVSPLDKQALANIPISPAQERLLFLHELDQNRNAYNIAIHLKLADDVRLDAFEKALRSAVARHEALRTLLVAAPLNGLSYRQKIVDHDTAQNMFILKASEMNSEACLHGHMDRAAQYCFQLDRHLPFTAFVFKLISDGRISYYGSLVFHHSAFDVWSWHVFRNDLAQFYAVNAGHKHHVELPSLRVQYKEYSVEHRQGLYSQRFEVLSNFWSRRLSGMEPISLITDKPRPADFDYRGRDVQVTLEADLTSQLRVLAKREGASLYTIMLATYCYLLKVCTMQRDISVGIPASHRNRAEYESVIGFFVNLLPMRVEIGDEDVHRLIAKVQKELVDAQVHMDMPFQEITKLMNEKHDPSRHPLVQTVFNWEGGSSRKYTIEQAPILEEYMPCSTLVSVAKFDLNVTVKEVANASLHVNFNYATSLFNEETIQGHLDLYVQLLKTLAVSPPDLKLSRITFVDQSQEESASATADEGSQVSSLSTLFEIQSAMSPQKTAVTEGLDKRISYADLNARANQLAHYMIAQRGIQSDDRVALMLDKSVEMLVCILAVWKSGAAYVPLDPSYPTQRVNYIWQDTGAKLLITTINHQQLDGLDSKITTVVVDDRATQQHVQVQSCENPKVPDSKLSTLAYIIFTSGTTGKPKGVMVEHKSVANLQKALVNRYFGSSSGTHSVLFLSNYVFDFSVEQIALSILSGNTLIIPPEEGITHEKFYELANAANLSYLSGTPSVLQQIQLSRLESLQIVTAAGEEFHQFQFENIRKQFTGQINNAYGITETTVYNLVTSFKDDEQFTKDLCDELPGSRVYVLNDHLQAVPANAVGELYLTGECVAWGYLNQEELTQQRFISNPFCKSSRFCRMYKTGDLVRYRGLNRLEYLGRRDQQIKLRGFRIELSEVQTALASVPGVKDAAVLPRYSDTKGDARPCAAVSELVGYYNVHEDAAYAESDVRSALASVLPSFMIPKKLYCLQQALPLTINGKLDTKKLTALEMKSLTNQSVAPRNVLEAKLCSLWAAAMGKAHSGIDDDVFTSGGDSISSLQLVGDIYRHLGRKVSVKDIFFHRTVRGVYDNVLSQEGGEGLLPPLRADQGLIEGEAPLLPIQEWFMSKNLINPAYWNHCFSIRTSSLDVDTLAGAIRMLQLRHDVLRMTVRTENGKHVQSFVSEVEPIQITSMNVSNMTGPDHTKRELSKQQSQFNIEQGPLFAVAYLHGYDDGSARIWCSFHHLIMDTVSWNIIRSDLQMLYEGADLGMKSSSVQQWAQAIEAYTPSGSEQQYWDQIRQKAKQTSTALTGALTGRAWYEDELSTEETASLFQQCCSNLQANLHEILLMCVGSALQRIIVDAPSVVTMEGHGREENVDQSLDLSRTVGWFTSMYPFEIPRVSDPVKGVMDIKHCVSQVPNHGVGYGAIHGYSDDSLPPVSVNYLGRLDQAQRRPGDWVLAMGENEPCAGLHTAPEDRDASSSVLDITFSAVNGNLKMQIAGSIGSQALEDCVHTMKSALRDLIARTSDKDFEPSLTETNNGHFLPYFLFDDESRHGPPLFLLPPGEGGAESYFQNLVQGLPRRKLVVLNNHYRDSNSLSTLEELAEYYLAHVRKVQPQGPYNIVGWSFGGILALEMAQRLGHQGDRVGTLGLIDPYFNIPRATEAIGMKGKQILDVIYDIYRPDASRFSIVTEASDNVLLFKAKETDTSCGTPEQKELYKWYTASPLNNLDEFIDEDSIEVRMLHGSHFTWVHRQDTVRDMCALLEVRMAEPSKTNGIVKR